jgi:hypothetical protein
LISENGSSPEVTPTGGAVESRSCSSIYPFLFRRRPRRRDPFAEPPGPT